ncbi:hypothetical protein VNO77_04860 [Canavalia gladiata]|uniref:Uncharacterized protein n=1 Tax=Canavalia gladiata TaxID=3824 RepID=A0AAN9N2Y9_CANGL
MSPVESPSVATKVSVILDPSSDGLAGSTWGAHATACGGARVRGVGIKNCTTWGSNGEPGRCKRCVCHCAKRSLAWGCLRIEQTVVRFGTYVEPCLASCMYGKTGNPTVVHSLPFENMVLSEGHTGYAHGFSKGFFVICFWDHINQFRLLPIRPRGIRRRLCETWRIGKYLHSVIPSYPSNRSQLPGLMRFAEFVRYLTFFTLHTLSLSYVLKVEFWL